MEVEGVARSRSGELFLVLMAIKVRPIQKFLFFKALARMLRGVVKSVSLDSSLGANVTRALRELLKVSGHHQLPHLQNGNKSVSIGLQLL